MNLVWGLIESWQTFEKKNFTLVTKTNTPVHFVRMAEAPRFDLGREFNGKNFFIY